ncbi:hypothetical protein MMMDOFMJ_3683 [Methylobacterium gnaphalii]|uniref:Uncharacterized protein n=1 Tax=Methylobacterium gnaphalii TaxID=1010610 RepID=A0A512JQJ3_9HYPH|nr:hypothetical protein MGN01_40570 [Methylobacterium gnaphalii]GJD70730.1 hypothetical protein MMMDOFMJ_3683 [Methylobacterium gnaphalii]GLS51539.1 hypothetical protein GCM10007885_43970 [Methylobacterium gnaphalii]
MRMTTIPNQSSVPMAYKEFDDDGRMKPGLLYERVAGVCEELMRFTLLTRERPTISSVATASGRSANLIA